MATIEPEILDKEEQGESGAKQTPLRDCTTAKAWTENLIRLYRETQQEDLAYLDAHPEIQEIIQLLVDEIQKNKPKNVHRFAALYFQHNRKNIQLKSLNF